MKEMKIRFNKPYLAGKELYYISKTIHDGRTAGNNSFTKKVHQFFSDNYGFKKSLLTTSCTDALEMSALLLDIMPGDEVIIPSYTFVSTANPFILRGAKIVFADSLANNPNIDPDSIEQLITAKTKAIVVVHYAGIACDMDKVLAIANKHKLKVVEDAAQAIDSTYKKKPLGSLGNLGTFSFHETKNIICGEGGLLSINDEAYIKRSEILWEKGTNRAAFFRGEIDKYGWVDVGSSFLASEILAAFLYAQLENLTDIQTKRKNIWSNYYQSLEHLAKKELFELPDVPEYATQNGHLFYLVTRSLKERSDLIKYLLDNGIHSVFHYISLHSSEYFKDKYDGRPLANCDKFSDRLLRLPLFYELTESQQAYIIEKIANFYAQL